jgi:hypothetical protein
MEGNRVACLRIRAHSIPGEHPSPFFSSLLFGSEIEMRQVMWSSRWKENWQGKAKYSEGTRPCGWFCTIAWV